jgi:hypothetical protein
MKILTIGRLASLCVMLAGMAVVGGCGGDSKSASGAPVPPAAAPTVPNSAGASSAAFVAYVKTLSAGDETSDPLMVNGDFVPPAEDTDEPLPL